MPKFRKKPIIVEAEQWFPGKEVEGVTERVTYGYIEAGSHIVDAGDWVITRTTGERYPCKDAIFRATYESVEDEQQLLNQDVLQRLEERVCIEIQAVKEGLKVPHASGITGIQECPQCGAVIFEVDMSKVVPLESQEG